MKNDVGRFNLVAALTVAISLGVFLYARPNVTYSFAVTIPAHSDSQETDGDDAGPSDDYDSDSCDERESRYTPQTRPASGYDDDVPCLADPMAPDDTFPA